MVVFSEMKVIISKKSWKCLFSWFQQYVEQIFYPRDVKKSWLQFLETS